MKRLRTVSFLAVLATAAASLATNFIWTGLDASNSWNQSDNWSSSALGEFPDGADDDVSIPANGVAVWAIDLTTETVGDITINASVDFGAVSGTPTLQTDYFVMCAPVGVAIELTISGDATIDVHAP